MNISQAAEALNLSGARVRMMLRQGREMKAEQEQLPAEDQHDAYHLLQAAKMIDTEAGSGVQRWDFDPEAVQALADRRNNRPAKTAGKASTGTQHTSKMWKIRVDYENYEEVKEALAGFGIELQSAYGNKKASAPEAEAETESEVAV